jgi:N-acetylglucosamine-6-phosphate deacetylase
MIALTNGRIVLPDSIFDHKALLIDGQKIIGVADSGSLPSEAVRLDAGGRLITPGLIDIHTHGALGTTFNEPSIESFTAITRENASRGVTSLLATLAPAPIPDLVQCLGFCRRWMNDPHDGTKILGMYLETPYVSPAQKGALDPKYLRLPNDGTPEILLEHHDIIKVFMIAPELDGALELYAKVNRLGILPAAGHSSAKDDQVLAAMKAGMRHITHIWSAQSSTIREGPWRKPGLLESSLTFDGLTVEMISDNKHLPPTLMKLAYKCVGADRLCAISDATSGAGLPEGSRFKMGGMEYEVCDGVGMMFDRSAFAGSTTLVNQMIPILNEVVGIPLVEVIRMLTLTPAKATGVSNCLGSLEAGKEADVAIFNDDYTAWKVMQSGQWIFSQ